MLKRVERTWSVIFAGDAWMSPYERTHAGGAIDLCHHNVTSGLTWLQRFRDRCPNSIWLNPEPRRIWNAPSVRIISEVFPMFELTLDGLSEAVDVIAGRRSNQPAGAASSPWTH